MKKHFVRLALAAVTLSAAPAFLAPAAYAQSITAGDISGTLTDASGAVVPGGQITATNIATGASKTATASASGAFRISLLVPGTYKISATANGFAVNTSEVTVGAGTVTTADIKLNVGGATTTVEVTAAPEIINTENGDVSTVIGAQEVQSMPNPGNDLTFVAQIAPGSTMNTGGNSGDGYGNFSSFGISGLSNMFTLDGGYENDPFLNLNNTGASNLTLGNNEVDTVTVVAPAYSAQFGGLGGAQVNEITKGGGNRVHGNATYYWDGRVMNANDWFNKQNQVASGIPNKQQFVNANQWAAAIGGPIVRDRLFWFVNTEGMRVTTPNTGQVYAPSPAFQACSLTGVGCAALNTAADTICVNSGFNNCTGGQYGVQPFAQAPASQTALLSTIYGVYNNSPYRPKTGVSADPLDASAVTYYAQSANFLAEWQLTGRVDYKISDKDTFYIHYKQDHGVQPTYVDLVDPRFSTLSPQPAWEGQLNETHNFSPNIVNQLVIAGNYYSAVFQNVNNYLPVAPFSLIFETGDLANTTYGGIDFDFPQGRKVAGYQIIDDLSWTHGKNTVRFGYNFRRDNITDLPQVRSIATEEFLSTEAFGVGSVDVEHAQYFPQRLEQPVAVYNEGFYAQDAFKFSPTFTVTAGLRVEHNSNPTCLTNCMATLAGDVTSLPTGAASAAAPYSAAFTGGLIAAGRHQAFKSFQSVGIMPRVSFAWQPLGVGKTVIRGGFGMFTDSFPGAIADTLLSNAPTNFHGIVYGTLEGGATDLALTPTSTAYYTGPNGVPTGPSGQFIAVQSATAFRSQFNSGGNYTTTSQAVVNAGGVYSTPAFSTTVAKIKYPTYEEWSLALEHPIDKVSTISVLYVGNHGYHEPVANGGYNLSTGGHSSSFFPTVPGSKPVTAFAGITNYYSGASSNYNGVVVSAVRHSKQITMQLNYSYSKALDVISNGGLEAFNGDAGDAVTVENPNQLSQQYGRADYDVRHNVTGLITWAVPSYHRLRAITGGFEFNSVIFHNSGLPYSVTQSTSSVGTPTGGKTTFANGSTLLLAQQLNNNFDRHCGGGNHVLLPGGGGNPCNFTNSFGAPTNFGQQGRNTLTGPSYTNVDFGAFKVIPIYKVESVKLKVGAQFFNFFNHPNFQNPVHTLSAAGNSEYGLITGTVGAPTSIFGSTGASSSPRLIQLTGKLTF